MAQAELSVGIDMLRGKLKAHICICQKKAVNLQPLLICN